MVFTEKQIRSQKRKNMALIILLGFLLALGIFFLIGSVTEILGNRVTNVDEISALDMQEKNIYYFEELTLLDTFGSVQNSYGYTSSRDFLVSFTDGEGTLYYTAIRLEKSDEPYFTWTDYLDSGIGDETVSGCFHFYKSGMGAAVQSAFEDACEAYSDGEMLAVSFFYDAKDPAACLGLDGVIILVVMGLFFAVPSLIGIILLIKKRKKIGIVQTQPEARADEVAQKFIRTCEAVQIWKYIVWGICLAGIVCLVLVICELLPVGFIALFSMSWLFLLIYYCISLPVVQCKKLLDAEGITQDMIVSDLIHADFVAEQFRCGRRVLLLKGRILPIRPICWLFQYEQLYMGLTTARYIHLYTIDGKRIMVDASETDILCFKELLNRNRDKFRPDLILGYTGDTKRRYKELRKAYKAQR